MVSVIIPIYNTELYLNKCLESITNQTYRNLEIILVDDCSNDGSADVIDRWKLMDKRIIAVHKNNNTGVSNSRNIGLLSAHGEYIVFVDSDDYISSGMIEKLLQKQKETGAELVCSGFSEIDTAICHFPPNEQKTLPPRDVIATWCFPAKGQIDTYIWGKLYVKNALFDRNNHLIMFREDRIYGEDAVWLMQIMLNITTVAFCQEILYYYRKSRTGNTYSSIRKNSKYAPNAIMAYQEVFDRLQHAGIAVNPIRKRILSHKRRGMLTALNCADVEVFTFCRKDYLSELGIWTLNDHTFYGFCWATKRLIECLIITWHARKKFRGTDRNDGI